jgi:hypothetical protein
MKREADAAKNAETYQKKFNQLCTEMRIAVSDSFGLFHMDWNSRF